MGGVEMCAVRWKVVLESELERVRVEEREESEIERNGPLQGQDSSPINRGRQGDEYKPINKANRDL